MYRNNKPTAEGLRAWHEASLEPPEYIAKEEDFEEFLLDNDYVHIEDECYITPDGKDVVEIILERCEGEDFIYSEEKLDKEDIIGLLLEAL